MTFSLLLKTSLVWLVIAFLAVLNGGFRENVLVKLFGKAMALPLSGISLSIIVIFVTYFSFQFFAKYTYLTYFLIGLQWLVMTLLFEFVFGRFVLGKSWSDLLQVFNIFEGNLFALVLLVTLISPLLVAWIKGLL